MSNAYYFDIIILIEYEPYHIRWGRGAIFISKLFEDDNKESS